MSLLLAPYTNAMRIGQGFNSYTQQICIDDAVVIDGQRPENILTNDGATMRTMAESSGKPSAWTRVQEIVAAGPSDALLNPEKAAIPSVPSQTPHTPPPSLIAPPVLSESENDLSKPAVPGTTTTGSAAEEIFNSEEQDHAAENSTSEDPAPASEELEVMDTSAEESVILLAEDGEEAGGLASGNSSAVVLDQGMASVDEAVNVPKSGPPAARASSGSGRNRSLSVGRTAQNRASGSPGKVAPARFQVKDIPTRVVKPIEQRGDHISNTSATAKQPATKPLSGLEIEQARLDKIEKLEIMRAEKKRLAEQREYERKILLEQREYQRKVDMEAREAERILRQEDLKEQQEIRKEKREYDKARREAAQKAINEAASAHKQALSMEDMRKIKAQNQFADHFDGIVKTTETYTFDPYGAKGPSQVVTYSSRFIDKLSDVTDDMCVSAALSVKAGKVGASGKGSFVDSDKFKQSDLNFYISVKVVNQTINFKDALKFNQMRSVAVGSEDFTKVYGDSFISGFVEGGEFNAIVSMKVHNKAKLLDIQAEAKVALTMGPVDVSGEANIAIARTNLDMNTETTIQVSWSGGGNIKPREQPWNIDTIMQAAARFPELVASCPQRTYAILTKYDSLRSYVTLRPAAYSPIQYESAQIYTNVLMDAFMSYKALYKRLGDEVTGIQNKTKEFETAASTEDTNALSKTRDADLADTSSRPLVTPDSQVAVQTSATTDITRFDASLRGLSEARKQIRRQMINIVNEIDAIEKDPKIATDDDHQEPFQAPLLFETRLPVTRVPAALMPATNPLTGERMIARTETEAEQLKREQQKNESPLLYTQEMELQSDEKDPIDIVFNKYPGIGNHFKVSQAYPATTLGTPFNNLEFLLPEWQVESVTIGITARGCVGSVEVTYDNGLVLKKGLKSAIAAYRTLNNFRPGERITSASIEVGSATTNNDSATDGTGLRVLSIYMYTNRGRRLLGQATLNEVLDAGKVRKDGTEYEKVQTFHTDCVFNTGGFKGFFGRLAADENTGGILRLGIIWGDTALVKTVSTTTDSATSYEIDSLSSEATIASVREERDAMKRKLEQALEQVQKERTAAANNLVQQLEQVRKQDTEEKNAAIQQAQQQQTKFANGVSTGRHSVSFHRSTGFGVTPSDSPFLTFADGTNFKLNTDGDLVVFSAKGGMLWCMRQHKQFSGTDRCRELRWHVDNDGNLVAWKDGQGAVWATETKECANGFLVLSNQAPYLEIFDREGRRRANYP